MTLTGRIVDALRSRQLCAKQLAAELGEPFDVVQLALVRLLDRGEARPQARKRPIAGFGRARPWELAR